MPMITIHPGEHLALELEKLSMTAEEFACRLGVATNSIADLLGGRRGVAEEDASVLGRYFGTSSEFWRNLQRLYDLRTDQAR